MLGGVGGGDMISQGGLQEVRVGLTCIRIKQCWEVVFFRGQEEGGRAATAHCQWTLNLGVFGWVGLPLQLQLRN